MLDCNQHHFKMVVSSQKRTGWNLNRLHHACEEVYNTIEVNGMEVFVMKPYAYYYYEE
jgi:hypothetical protein